MAQRLLRRRREPTYGVYCTQAGDYWNGQVLVYSSAHGCHALYLVRVPRPA